MCISFQLVSVTLIPIVGAVLFRLLKLTMAINILCFMVDSIINCTMYKYVSNFYGKQLYYVQV